MDLFGSEHRDGSIWVQNIVMDSEAKMFLFTRRVFFLLGLCSHTVALCH